MDCAGLWNGVGKSFPLASFSVAHVKLIDDHNAALRREVLYLSFTN